VNQAVGRCIRHIHDYGAIILLDQRFQQQQALKHNLSKWVRDCLCDYATFEACQQSLKAFFESQHAPRAVLPPESTAPALTAQTAAQEPGATSHRYEGTSVPTRAASAPEAAAAVMTGHDAGVLGGRAAGKDDAGLAHREARGTMHSVQQPAGSRVEHAVAWLLEALDDDKDEASDHVLKHHASHHASHHATADARDPVLPAPRTHHCTSWAEGVSSRRHDSEARGQGAVVGSEAGGQDAGQSVIGKTPPSDLVQDPAAEEGEQLSSLRGGTALAGGRAGGSTREDEGGGRRSADQLACTCGRFLLVGRSRDEVGPRSWREREGGRRAGGGGV
jgi:hypothetical protein